MSGEVSEDQYAALEQLWDHVRLSTDIGSDEIREAINRLNSDQLDVFVAAAHLLGASGDQRARHALVQRLQEEENSFLVRVLSEAMEKDPVLVANMVDHGLHPGDADIRARPLSVAIKHLIAELCELLVSLGEGDDTGAVRQGFQRAASIISELVNEILNPLELEAEPVPVPRGSRSPADNGPIRVLMVDDYEAEYRLIRYHLQSSTDHHYELDWAPTFAAGLEAMKRGEHDIYLVDYLLDEGDGLELMRQAMDAGVQAPLLLLTGVESPQIDRSAQEAGAAGYIVKGEMKPSHLERALRYAVARSRQARADAL